MKTITSRVPRDNDFPERVWQISVRKRVLDGTLYNVMPYQFHEDRKGRGGDFIPEHDRAPSVSIGLALVPMVIEDLASFVFGEGRWPQIHTENLPTKAFLADLVKTTGLPLLMRDAIMRGSVGSTAIRMRVLSGRVFFDILDTQWLTPVYNPMIPDELLRVIERYKVKGSDLRDQGYTIAADALNADHWFMRIFDSESETFYQPWPVKNPDDTTPQIDPTRSITHPLGFVPIVWIQALSPFNGVDGACIFDRALEAVCTIDYRMSGAGRALKYASDPTLLIKSPAFADADVIRNASTALIVAQDGDAKVLEIAGSGQETIHNHVDKLREFALEAMHAVRVNPERVASATSGKALEVLYQPTLRLADALRASYGEAALLAIANMVLKAADRLSLKINGADAPKMPLNQRLSLAWPEYYPASPHDRLENAQALTTLAAAGHISKATAVRSISHVYDVEDITVELNKIMLDQAAEDARLKAQAAQVQDKESLH